MDNYWIFRVTILSNFQYTRLNTISSFVRLKWHLILVTVTPIINWLLLISIDSLNVTITQMTTDRSESYGWLSVTMTQWQQWHNFTVTWCHNFARDHSVIVWWLYRMCTGLPVEGVSYSVYYWSRLAYCTAPAMGT